MNTIVFDLETYRTRDEAIASRIVTEARAKRPSQNTAVKLKEMWDKPEQTEARIAAALDKTAVDVLIAEPLCCCMDVDGQEVTLDIMEAPEDAQLAILAEYLKNSTQQTVWVGHNVEFDLSILLNRWRRFRIAPPMWFPDFRGRWHGRVHDTMRTTPCENGMGLVSLSDVCEAYALPEAKATIWDGAPMEGKRVGEAFRAGAFDIIREYCMADVRVTKALYEVQSRGGRAERYHTVSDQFREIEAQEMPEGARAIAKLQVLNSLGFLPA